MKLRWGVGVLLALLLFSGCIPPLSRGPKPIEVEKPDEELQSYVRKAERAVERGDLKEAERLYKTALAIDPNSPQLYAKLAGVYVALDEIEKAIRAFKKSLALDPENVPNRNYLGYLYEKLGFYSRAAVEFERALEVNPKDLYALVHLGLCYRQLGRLDEAEVILLTAAELDPECKNPDSQNLYNYLGLVYQDKGEYEKAIQAYRKSIQINPEDTWAHNQLGSLFEELGRLYEAQVEYLETLKYDPQNPFALSRLAAIQQRIIAGRINIEPVEFEKEDLKEILKNAPSAADYPKADAVVLLNKFSYLAEKNGTLRFTVHQVIKILTPQGAVKYGQISIPFNRRYQNIGVNIAKTYLPDGTVLEPPDDAFNDITPPGYAEMGLFSDVMWKVITMPGVRPGAVIEYQATVEDIRGREAGGQVWFWGGMEFGSTDPILRSKYELRVPRGREFKWKTYNCELRPRIVEDGDYLVYIWEYGEAPAVEEEIGMPPLQELVPRLAFSSVGSWEEVAGWFWGMFSESAKASQLVKAKAMELTQGIDDPEGKIEAIYEFVASNIRYVALMLGEGTYKPHPAADVLEHGYGDCKDKVALLVAMLKAVGVEAYPALISPQPHPDVDESLPSPGQFSHLIAAIPREDGYIWLDPTAETCPFGYLPFQDQGRKALLIKGEKEWSFERTPVYPPESNGLRLVRSLKLLPDGSIEGEERTVAWGQQGMIHRFVHRLIPERRVKELVQMEMAARYPGAEVVEVKRSDPWKLEDPFEVVVKFRAPGPPAGSGAFRLLPIPGEGFSELASLVWSDERRYELRPSTPPGVYERRVEVELGPWFEVEAAPGDEELRNGAGSIVRRVGLEGDRLVYSMRFVLRKWPISPESYGEAKELLERVAREDGLAIAIRRVRG